MSRPQRHSAAKPGKKEAPRKPLKRISLNVTVDAPKGGPLDRSASDSGLVFSRKGGSLTFQILATTPEEALEKLKALGEIFASKS